MVNGKWMKTCGLVSGAVRLIRLTFNITFAPSFLTFPSSLCWGGGGGGGADFENDGGGMMLGVVVVGRAAWFAWLVT